jgi:hypothetical protein
MKYTVHLHPELAQDETPPPVEAGDIEEAIRILTDDWDAIVCAWRMSEHMTYVSGGDSILIFTDGKVTPTDADWRDAKKFHEGR